MRRFNVSAWALHNRGLVLYFMVALAIIGSWSYLRLGQSEDPPFTFKVMVVRTLWPGATAEEVSRQVTERVEKAVAVVNAVYGAPARLASMRLKARRTAKFIRKASSPENNS